MRIFAPYCKEKKPNDPALLVLNRWVFLKGGGVCLCSDSYLGFVPLFGGIEAGAGFHPFFGFYLTVLVGVGA